MKLREIYDFLDSISPFELQESWDNSGLLLGDTDSDIEEICLSLDIDTDLVDSLADGTLLVTHHPLIFKGLKRIDSSYPSNIVKKMIKKDISLISMHTNFDKTHLNRYVLESVLGYEIKECEDFVCYFDVEDSFENFCLHVKSSLGIENLKVVKASDYIKRGAITTGSGGDLIGSIDAECYLSGDFKYHQALEAKENNLSLIEIGHYESERFFAEALEPHLKNLSLKVIMSNSKNPFEYK